jgi:NAD(P)-dependent dehydrogenase (short-subunit alcohol dehydrogenase family)
MKIDLSGRTALVTGSTRGIGNAIARTLVEAGARVAFTGRDAGRAEEASAASGGAGGFACDIADSASIEGMIAEVERGIGPVYILVNNAGLTRYN